MPVNVLDSSCWPFRSGRSVEPLSPCPPSSGMFQGWRNNESPPAAQVVKEASSLGHCGLGTLLSGYSDHLEFVCTLEIYCYETMKRWGLWEVGRSQGYAQEGKDFPDEVTRGSPVSPSAGRGCRKKSHQMPRALIRPILQPLCHEPDISVVYTRSRLKCFVIQHAASCLLSASLYSAEMRSVAALGF